MFLMKKVMMVIVMALMRMKIIKKKMKANQG